MIFLLVYIVFYPPIYAIHDEAAYMAQAYVMREGTIFGDVAGIQVAGSIKTESGHFVSRYAPGISFLLIPFSFLGWKFFFLLPLLLHLVGFFIFVKILRIYSISPYFSLLYLLYPTSVLYSRTLMADVPSAVFFIVAIYFFLRGKKFYFLSGFFLGMLPLFRYPNIILSVPFFIYLLVDSIKSARKSSFAISPFSKLFLGFLPGLFLFLFYNKIAFGRFLIVPYGLQGYFSVINLPYNLCFYILSLNVIYPFMFFSIFLLRKDRFVLISSTFLLFLFYALFKYMILAPGKSMLKTSIVGMRYLLPIIPIFILSYVNSLERIKRKKPILANMFFLLIVIVFFILDIGLVYQHQGFLKTQEQYKDIIYSNTDQESLILINDNAMEFFQHVWGERKYEVFVWSKNKLAVDFEKYHFEKLYLLTVIRSDKEGNEYVRKYADEIIKEYSGETVAEIKGDPELRLWKLHYESANDSVSEKRSIGEAEKEIQKREE